MKTAIGNMIRITDPCEDLKKWVKDHLVFPNPDYEKKQRMGFWVGRTPHEIRLYEWHGKDLLVPFGICREIMPMLREGEIITEFSQDEEIDYGMMDCLFDYQQTALQKMADAKYGILKSAAGSGKTQIGIAMIQYWKRKALWICHTADLLRQSKERAERYIPKELIGTITEGKVNIGQGVTFATVQTMSNLFLPMYMDEWDVIIVDECHHVSASATSFTRYQKVLNNLCARHKYGLTATPERSDGLIKATFSMLGKVMYEVPEEATANRVMKVTVQRVNTDAEINDECLNDDGTINYTKMISQLIKDEKRNIMIARKIIEEKNHSCIILSDRLEQLVTIRNLLPYEMQEKSAYIDGKMQSKKAKAEREQILNEMREGKKQYLFASYSLAKEGLDIPRLDRLFLASPVKYSSVIIQSVGRISRVYEGKQKPVCFDFVDKNIGYCEKAYRERKRHYRKLGSEIIE